jgi:hypothetical protein
MEIDEESNEEPAEGPRAPTTKTSEGLKQSKNNESNNKNNETKYKAPGFLIKAPEFKVLPFSRALSYLFATSCRTIS